MMDHSFLLVYSILFLLVSSASLLIGLYVISVHSAAEQNRVFFAVCVLLFIWSFSFSIAIVAPNEATCLFWRRLSALGWGSIYAALFHFVLILTEHTKILQKKWFYPLLYLPAALTVFIFSLFDATARTQYHFVNLGNGWTNSAVNNVWDCFFYVYYAVYTLVGVFLLWRWERKAVLTEKKVQAKIILVSFLSVIGFGSFTDLINNSLSLLGIPQMAPVFFIIPIFSIFYCMKKYRFMNNSVVDNAEIILNDANRFKIYNVSSAALIIGGGIYFAAQFLLSKQEGFLSSSVSAAGLIVLGIVFQMIQKIKNSSELLETVYVIMTMLVIPIYTIKFIAIAGATIWTLSFIILICSLIFNKRLVLVSAAVSALLTEIYLWIRVPDVQVTVDNGHFVARIGVLSLSIFVAFNVNRIYTLRLKENAEQTRIQKLVSEISTDCVLVDQTNILDKLNAALEMILSFFKIDRTCLYLTDDEYREFPGMLIRSNGRIHQNDEFPLEFYSRLTDYVGKKRGLEISDIRELPADAETAREYFTGLQIKSLLSIPISVKGRPIGVLNLESVSSKHIWQNKQKDLLIIISNILSDAIIKVNAEKKIKSMAYYDGLTKLPNRLLFRERAEQAIARASRTGELIGIMFLDLDSFKSINDTMGHAGGDLLIQNVARLLLNSVRKSDTVARFGGDEFLIMLNGVSDLEEVVKAAENVMELFRNPVILNGQELFITASVGVAMYPVDGQDMELLVKNADIAMYNAKSRGKNQYALCSDAMKESVEYKMKLTNDLYRALDRKELVIHYQPQISLQSEKVIGLEALLRWNHPRLGMVMPKTFIPLAEQTGLINPIGEWVLETACQQSRHWQAMGLPRVSMSVNLSAVQLRNQKFVEQVNRILRQTGLDPKLLELEITESAMIRESDSIISILNSLKKLGICISIDDFGTEYSSLSRLKSLPIDSLKMDIQFVHGIDKSPKDQAITMVIISLAKNLDLKLTAEGVEKQSQLNFLKQRMCDEVQGFYYYKPMPAEEIEALLRSQQQGSPSETAAQASREAAVFLK